MGVEQDHIGVSDGYGGQGGDICHVHMAMSRRRDVREASRMKSFLFFLLVIESWGL